MRLFSWKHVKALKLFVCLSLIPASFAHATIFSQFQGLVHDPQHRPIAGAHITLSAAHSAFAQSADTNDEGSFSFPDIPLGDYTVTVSHSGFRTLQQSLTIYSDTSSIFHFELQLGTVQQTVTVTTPIDAERVDTVTPTTLVDRTDI